jgi:hypothetical protein
MGIAFAAPCTIGFPVSLLSLGYAGAAIAST